MLQGRHLAGLGFGTGFDHTLPPALVREAAKLDFPVFEVPYELPFIAITEKAFTQLVNEQYEILQRSSAIQKRLERLVLEERGLDELVRALAAAIGGAVVVLSARGEPIASGTFHRELPEEADRLRGRAPPPDRHGPTRPSSRPTTLSWRAARWSCRWPCAARAPRPGCWPPATRAGSATSSA